MSDFYTNTYNPDVLSCLANLSNDEVFTSPDVVNKMLDLLPQELFQDPDATFLEPATKSGIFLREIAKRLLIGLEPIMPDLQERIDHIFQKQLYGIAITELTSLLARRSVYCSKFPNGKLSISEFDNPEGNIRFKKTEHEWDGKKCVFCGASKAEYDRGETLETHAYEFIHTSKPEGIFNMKFDVIIGNPPYHLTDSGHGVSAKPIYHLFVDQAKKLQPRYLLMIIPARWYSGGKGLNSFRHNMLNDRRIRTLVDYENFRDVFPGVDLAGGACYFLWDRDYEGPCTVTNFTAGLPSVMERYLDEFDILIRQNLALDIIRKIQLIHGGNYLDTTVSSRKPFGLPTNYTPKDQGIPCWFIQRIGKKHANKEDVSDSFNLLNKWKLLIPKSPIAGQTDFSKPIRFYYDGNVMLAAPGECCTESFIVAGAFDTEDEVLSFKSYLFTKTVRFLLLQTVVSQDVTKGNFRFVPDLGTYNGEYTDARLREKWNITDDEWGLIDSRILHSGGE